MFGGKNKFDEHLQRAIALYNDKSYSDALNEINAALDTKADSAEAYFYKGLILMELKNYRGAASAFNYASSYDPKNAGKYEPYLQKSMTFLNAEGVQTRYLGGHSAFANSMDVHVQLKDDALEIPEMKLHVPYEKITKVQTKEVEEYNTGGIILGVIFIIVLLILLGIIGLLVGIVIAIIVMKSKSRTTHTVVGFKDELGLEHDMAFQGIGFEANLYDKVKGAKSAAQR